MSMSVAERRRVLAKLQVIRARLEADPSIEDGLWRRPEIRRAVRRVEQALAAVTRGDRLS